MKYSEDELLTRSLQEESWGKKAARIMAASLAAVDPSNAIRKSLVRNRHNQLLIREEMVDLDHFQRVIILSIGKAALPMALSTSEILGDSLDQALILTKAGTHTLPDKLPGNFSIYFGGHPVPDKSSIESTSKILEQLPELTSKDLVFLLISGGGSALLTYPAKGLNLNDLQQTNQVLLKSGAAIEEINTIRKHLSLVKGGQLSRILLPAKTISLILSDVIGDQIDLISSGPTSPDPSSYQDAIAVVQKYDLQKKLSPAVMDHLKSGVNGDRPETPKPGDDCFLNSDHFIIAGNNDAVQGGLDQARLEGFVTRRHPDLLIGEASLIGNRLANDLIKLSNTTSRPLCLITGGETTVTLPDTPTLGKGGRNLELALSAVKILEGSTNLGLITLATDGEDGITDAAGAIVTGKTYHEALKEGLDTDDYLSRHDSYNYFKILDDLIKPGFTQTNVNDLVFLFIL